MSSLYAIWTRAVSAMGANTKRYASYYLLANAGALLFTDRTEIRRFPSRREYEAFVSSLKFYHHLHYDEPSPLRTLWNTLEYNYFKDVPYSVSVRGRRRPSEQDPHPQTGSDSLSLSLWCILMPPP